MRVGGGGGGRGRGRRGYCEREIREEKILNAKKIIIN